MAERRRESRIADEKYIGGGSRGAMEMKREGVRGREAIRVKMNEELRTSGLKAA